MRENGPQAHAFRKAAQVNGFSPKKWKDCPEWPEVRDDIARTVFGRVLIGVNVVSADISRIKDGLWPRDTQWMMPYGAMDLQWIARMAGHQATSLDALCKAYDLPPEDIHDAVGGVRRVRAVAEAMLSAS